MKKKQDDFEYIKAQFDSEPVVTPSTLSEQAMQEKISRGEREQHVIAMPKSRRKTARSVIAVAACFVILLASGTGIYSARKTAQPLPLTSMTGVSYFTSYRQLESTVKAIEKRNKIVDRGVFNIFYGGFSKGSAMEVNDMAAPEMLAESVTGAGAADTQSADYAATNRQVAAVDEADIIKTDGNYIYYIPYGAGVKIYAADGTNTTLVSEIDIDDVLVNEMYLSGDQLVLLGTQYPQYEYIDDDGWDGEVVLYEDVAPPEETTAEVATEETEADSTEIAETTAVDTSVAMTLAVETEPTVSVPTETATESTAPAAVEAPQLPPLEEEEGDRTVALLYDLTDRRAPQLSDVYVQSGGYLSSRMLDGYLYIVSYFYSYDRRIPVCGNAEGCERIPIEDIVAIDGCDETDYAVIGALDTVSGEQAVTKAILGIGNDIYCNGENLYLFGDIYRYDGSFYDYSVDVQTQLMKYTLDGVQVALTASARVEGTTDNQFSLDEKDGNLRIATTSTNSDYQDTNNLFVLDSGLHELGRVTGFANNEHIEAVRYVGDTAYVVTFQQTDPLFLIDLSEPKNPTITGEVKLDGFSTFLTPVDDNTLLGIGYCTADNGFGGVYTNGLKLVLFDVSDQRAPKVLDEAVLPEAYSAAQETHKALVHSAAGDYYAIPMTVTDYVWDEYGNMTDASYDYDDGILQFRINGGHFTLRNLQTAMETERCTFIGDYLYAVSTDGDTVVAFSAD